MEPFVITAASESDAPVLLTMIRELAVFEKLERELEVTLDSLCEALFEPWPSARALIARCDGREAGYAVYYRTFSTFAGRAGVFLDDIYVRPAYRRRNLGRKLLQRVARESIGGDPGRFEWIALSWNERALRFYRDLGAELLTDWVFVRMHGEPLKKLIEEAP